MMSYGENGITDTTFKDFISDHKKKVRNLINTVAELHACLMVRKCLNTTINIALEEGWEECNL